MRWIKAEAVPSIPRILDRLEGRFGRFVIEDVPAGSAIVGVEPEFVLAAKKRQVAITSRAGVETFEADPFETLREYLGRFSTADTDPEVPFAGGAVGYLSYDLARTVEEINPLATEDVPTPDLLLGFYDSALCVDAAKGECTAVSRSGDEDALAFWKELAEDSPLTLSETGAPVLPHTVELKEPRSCFTKRDYIAAVERVREYIRAGDVCQVNLAQRFEAELRCSPIELYSTLRRVNPAPNACLIEIGGPTLVCASPETFLTYDPRTRTIVTKPIKGTRPRGRDEAEDARLALELAASNKDRAENVMIVDMLRNDLGRVAEYGSVSVPQLYNIEPHPTVFQMVSTVEALMDSRYDQVDLIKACFPGGSITGAPKIRAMQIIEELEPVRRGCYTGAAGYIDCRGYMDLNIVIRSFVTRGSKAYFHGGGGIVIDSDPEMEYRETMDKTAGLREALQESGGRQ